MLSQGHAPSRCIDDDAHQTPRNDTGDGQGDDPAEVDPPDHTPVDGPPGAGAQTDTDGGTANALSGGDGKFCIPVVSKSSR